MSSAHALSSSSARIVYICYLLTMEFGINFHQPNLRHNCPMNLLVYFFYLSLIFSGLLSQFSLFSRTDSDGLIPPYTATLCTLFAFFLCATTIATVIVRNGCKAQAIRCTLVFVFMLNVTVFFVNQRARIGEVIIIIE